MKKRDPKTYQNLQQGLSMKELREKKRQEYAEHDSHPCFETLFPCVKMH